MLYRPGTPDEAVLKDNFERSLYIPLMQVAGYTFAPHHVIVDVGAHIGAFAVFAAKQCHRVFAIEAAAENFDLLAANVALNRLGDRITVSRTALSDRSGVIKLVHSASGNWGHSLFERIEDAGYGSEIVPTTTIEDYFAGHGIESVDLLKMNVEGAEYPIITSAPRDLLANVGCAVIYYHNDIMEGHSQHELTASLQEAGLRCRDIPDRWLPDKRGTIVAWRGETPGQRWDRSPR